MIKTSILISGLEIGQLWLIIRIRPYFENAILIRILIIKIFLVMGPLDSLKNKIVAV